MELKDRRKLEARIARAAVRAEVSGKSSVVTLAVKATEVDPLAVIAHADPPFAYWEMPERGFSVAALGETQVIEPPLGGSRFRNASEALRDLAARTHQMAIYGVPRAPLLVGGFSFDRRSSWPDFPSGRLALPKLALIHRGSRQGVWVATTEIIAGDDPAEQAESLIDLIDKASNRHLPEILPKSPNTSPADLADLHDPVFLELATEAVGEVQLGDLLKVVLARQLEIPHRPDLGPFLASLRRIHNTSSVFAFGRKGGIVFCGATPELLAGVDGVSVSTLALAGTAPRGGSSTEDDWLADRLRADRKELEEHGHVLQEIRRRLVENGFTVGASPPTEVMKLPGIQHLATPVSAVAPVGTNVLDVVGALHPTPAVAGLPRDLALKWIHEHEPFARGWYAGPVGFCDLAGNGEFHVAIRSCLLDGKGSRLFAGAGILGDSTPEKELKETNLKLGAIMPSLSA